QYSENQRIVLGGNTFRVLNELLDQPLPENSDRWIAKLLSSPTTVVSDTATVGQTEFESVEVVGGDAVDVVARLKAESAPAPPVLTRCSVDWAISTSI
ncbi:hypothetical protein QSJ18_03400, partial [Gordonia sp. ABSL1-1]|nr:hypothetical protein [Gordonia sp. ABSL1-1]